MRTITQKPPLSVDDIDRLTLLAADVADHARIAGLDFAAALEEAVADSTELETARLAYLRGEAATAGADQLKAAAASSRRRAEAYASEATKTRAALEAVLGEGNDKAPFQLEVSVTDAKSQPLAGIEVQLTRGKTELGRAMTGETGMTEFRLTVAASKDTDAAGTKTLQRAIRQDAAIDVESGKTIRLTAVAYHARGKEIGRGGTDAVFEPGGSARIDIRAG